MLKINLTILILTLSFNLFGQTIEPSVEYYKNGQLFWKGQHICNTTPLGGKIGYMAGFWTYWYENGSEKLETFYWYKNNFVDSRVLYINMWLADGKQILKDGNGIYYTTAYPNDSLVFEIKDSVENGSFQQYRSFDKSKYFLVGSGQYKNSKRQGTFKLRDTVQRISEETRYENENEICDYKYYYPNFQLKEEGQKINNNKDGLWKYYLENGLLSKEVNYKNGVEYGERKDYFYDKKGKLKKTNTYTTDKNGSR